MAVYECLRDRRRLRLLLTSVGTNEVVPVTCCVVANSAVATLHQTPGDAMVTFERKVHEVSTSLTQKVNSALGINLTSGVVTDGVKQWVFAWNLEEKGAPY
jgi:hypothetical protein